MKTNAFGFIAVLLTLSIIGVILLSHIKKLPFINKEERPILQDAFNSNPRRRLLVTESHNLIESFLHPPNKLHKFHDLVKLTNATVNVFEGPRIEFEKASFPIVPSHNAIISCALSRTYIGRDAANFLGTARKSGFIGDLVIAILPDSDPKFINKLKQYNATIFKVSASCAGVSNVLCAYKDKKDIPLSLMRFTIYRQIASQYYSTAKIMISDFRDVFFQSNPFRHKSVASVYRENELMVFLESHPNRVIGRCPQNQHFISLCYGMKALQAIGSNTISSSGIIIGMRSAIVAYSHLLLSQSEPKNRLPIAKSLFNDTLPDPNNCLRFGVDMGFHNMLLYSNILSKTLDIKIFQQGEGPVNIVGGYYGENKLLRALLSEWKILRGDSPYKYAYSWNGEISPVVHQLDRFLPTELSGGYEKHMAAFQHLYTN